MADTKESVSGPEVTEPTTTTPPATATATPTAAAAPEGSIARPAGWMYKSLRFGKHDIWYASPIMQLLMVGVVCFLCPGMFNALSGLGGGGQLDTKASDDANTALYSTFAVVAFFSGTIANVLGVRLTLSLGGLGYCIYAASFLSYNINQNYGFVIFAGALLGVCAGMLWTAQGTIMMSYPTEESKGRYISWFWVIFNMGAVIGSLIPLGQNVNKIAGPVTNGTYAAFIVLMFLGAVLALCLCDAHRIRRDDGTRVILMKNPSWRTELSGLWHTLVDSPWIVLLFPMFFASNTFYTYQQNDMLAGYFNTRTRALMNVLYWTSQIFGAIVFGYALDTAHVRRSVRARASLVALFALVFAVFGGGWAWQRKQPSRAAVSAADTTYVLVDWTDGGEKFVGPMFLYMFYGFVDASWQTCVYWYMGALSNSGRKAANLAGFYKGIQSAGAAVFWRLDGLKKPYDTMFGATWGLLAGALLIASPVIFMRIQDTVALDEDLKFSDETVEDVLPAEALAATKHQHHKEDGGGVENA